MATYPINLKGKYVTNPRTIHVTAAKDTVSKFAWHLVDLQNIKNCERKLETHEDGTEYSLDSWVLGGSGSSVLRDEETYTILATDFFDALPDEIKAKEIPAIRERIDEIFSAHVKITDNRRTAEEWAAYYAQQHAENEQRERERIENERVRTAPFLAKYAQPEADGTYRKCKAGAGDVAITAALTYNATTVGDDYSRYSRVPDTATLVLAIVPARGAKTERTLRAIASQYEMLGCNWTWAEYAHTLSGNVTGEYIVWQDANGRSYNAWWVIETGYYGQEYYPALGYGKHAAAAAAPQQHAATNTGACKISRNMAHNGIELRFPDKPDNSTLDTVKSWGFRWSKFQKLWYAKYSPSMWERVNAHFGAAQELPAAPDAITLTDEEIAQVEELAEPKTEIRRGPVDAFAATFGSGSDNAGDMDTAHEDYLQDEIARAIGA